VALTHNQARLANDQNINEKMKIDRCPPFQNGKEVFEMERSIVEEEFSSSR